MLSGIGFILLLVLVGIGYRWEKNLSTENSNVVTTSSMKLTSSSLTHNGEVPTAFTCEGEDVSPDLQWSEVPEDAKSLVLVVHDPDAPKDGGWTHWVVINIPVTSTGIDKGAVPSGGTEVMNDFGRTAWGGPCPPDGEHRYYFKLYALNVAEISGNSLSEIEAAMEGRIIEQTELMSTYQLN